MWILKLTALGAAFAFLAFAVLSCSEAPSDQPQPYSGSADSIWSVGYDGLIPMEELLTTADAVARVEFKSARQTLEEIQLTGPDGPPISVYLNAIEITFTVHEYLMGSGATELKALIYNKDGHRYTRAEVEALNENLLPLRDTQWDDRQAIVFLRSGWVVSTVNDPNRYWMAAFHTAGEDGYSVSSRWARTWLPDASAPVQGASGAVETEQRFLVGLSGAEQGASRQVGQQGQTMTLTEINALVTKIQNELNASSAPNYVKCVRDKYYSARFDQWYKNDAGASYHLKHRKEIASGAPAGTVVYVTEEARVLPAERLPPPSDINKVIVYLGQDAELFAKVWPPASATARPLPQGTYRFYFVGQPEWATLCNATSDIAKTRHEVVVTVTTPEGTLHEAFFDPVTIGTGVGADSSNGVIKPAGFSVDGTSTSITGLKYDDDSVVLTLSPHVSLSGHKVEFIELDGLVGLSLEVSSATEDSTAGTLTWSVSDQPWHNADLLMLRIAASTTPEPTATPEPTPTPTSTPQPTPTPQQTSSVSVSLSPRDDPYITQTDITVSWSDSTPCQGSYFVGVSDSEGYLIRVFGSHPAPATTAIDADLSLPWDNVSNYSWTVSVRCDPSDSSSDWWMLGEVPLQSGLPSSP